MTFVIFQVEDLDSHSSWQCSASIRDLIYHTARDMVHTSHSIKSVKVKERRKREVIITTKPLNPGHSGIDREGVGIHRVIEKLGLRDRRRLVSRCCGVVLERSCWWWLYSAGLTMPDLPYLNSEYQWPGRYVVCLTARQSFMSFCCQFWETFESNKLHWITLG